MSGVVYERYDPCYDLLTMNLSWITAKLDARGNMTHTTCSDEKSIKSTSIQERIYEIHVKGQLDESWSDWLEGMEIKLLGDREMVLYGQIADQAALMGILNKLYRLNLALLSIESQPEKMSPLSVK